MPFDIPLGQSVPQRRIELPPFAVHIVQAQVALTIDDDISVCVREIEPTAQPWQYYYRKLQPFAFVHAHYPHDVFCLGDTRSQF